MKFPDSVSESFSLILTDILDFPGYRRVTGPSLGWDNHLGASNLKENLRVVRKLPGHWKHLAQSQSRIRYSKGNVILFVQ